MFTVSCSKNVHFCGRLLLLSPLIECTTTTLRMPLHLGCIRPAMTCAATVREMRWSILIQDDGWMFEAARTTGVLCLTCIEALFCLGSHTSFCHHRQVSRSASPHWSRAPSPDAFLQRRSSAYSVNVCGVLWWPVLVLCQILCLCGHLEVVCKKVLCGDSWRECSMKMMVILLF